jgi:aminopeptidase
LARHADLDPETYAGQVAAACYLNRTDPVAQWEAVFQKAQALKKRLNDLSVEKFYIESAGIDLEITPGRQRKWIGISGHNIPSFELFLSPDWHGTRGVYFADQPSYRSGNYVEGIRIEFKNGIAVRADAKQGQDFLRKQLAMDPGANKIGEFSLTDKSFSKINRFMANTLYDENYGGRYGNCHIALGASYSDTYSGNPSELTKDIKKELGFNDSALHWDIVNTEKKRVTAHLADQSRRVIYENGNFTL